MKKTLLTLIACVCMFCSASANGQQKTIVQTAIDAGNFETLVAAVKAAGLVDTLNGTTPLTVFAPTDEAFKKLDQSLLQTLLTPEGKHSLTQILTYHVVPGRVTAKAAYPLDSAKTVNGQRLDLNFRGGSLMIGEATVTVTDIQCSNGVIHVIDTVLVPKLENIPATATAAGQFNTLLAAVDAAGLSQVLTGAGPFTVLAPTDEAFAALPVGTVESLLLPENKQNLIDILKFHVISGRVYDTDAAKASRAKTLLGRSVEIGVDARGLTVNGAAVVAKNIETSNGVIHVIDQVLIPAAMQGGQVLVALTDAINRGVPAFNGGDPSLCADVYTQVLTSIDDAGIEGADQQTLSIASQTLARARGTSDATSRAWVLRQGIDDIMLRVQRMPMAIQPAR